MRNQFYNCNRSLSTRHNNMDSSQYEKSKCEIPYGISGLHNGMTIFFKRVQNFNNFERYIAEKLK